MSEPFNKRLLSPLRGWDGLSAAAARLQVRPKAGRYVPRLSMRVFIVVFAAMISSFAHSNSELDAENEGEAVGIIYGYFKKVDVVKFMCERKAPEKGALLSEAIDKWKTRNSSVVANLTDGLDRTPIDMREQLFEMAKQVSRNRIILFNKMSQSEKENTCASLAEHLNSDSYKNEYPIAYKLMSE